MRRQREQSADLCWQLDPDFEAAKVQFSRCLYSIQVFAEQEKEVNNMFQRLIDMTHVKGLWVRLVGLADARAEAHANSGALQLEIEAKKSELEIRFQGLQKAAEKAIDKAAAGASACVQADPHIKCSSTYETHAPITNAFNLLSSSQPLHLKLES